MSEHQVETHVHVRWQGGDATSEATRLEVSTGPVRTLRFAMEGARVDLRVEDGVPSGRLVLGGVERVPHRVFEVETGEAGEGLAFTRIHLTAIDAAATTRLVEAGAVDIVVLDGALGALLAEPPDPPAELDDRAFTDLFVEMLRERLPGVEVASPEPLSVTVGPPREQHLHLGNIRKSCPPGQRALAKALLHHVRAMLDSKAEAGPEQVLPVLRSEGLLEQVPAGATPLVTRPFAADIVVAYVFDLPDAMRYLNVHDLEALGVDPEGLHALALANLARALPRVERHGKDGRYMLICGGTYEASTLLLPDVWEALGDDLSVFVPARDLVLVARRDDTEWRAHNAVFARRIEREGSYPISTRELRWRDGAWAEERPEPPAEIAIPMVWKRAWPVPTSLSLLVLFAVGYAHGDVLAHLLPFAVSQRVWYFAMVAPVTVAWLAWWPLDDVRPIAKQWRNVRVRHGALIAQLALAVAGLALLAAGFEPRTRSLAFDLGGMIATVVLCASELLDNRAAMRVLNGRA
ncbi:MAG: hypothetical protein ACOZNI_05125 [Myxococcota bacterium]